MKKLIFIFIIFFSLFNISYGSYESQLSEINGMLSGYQVDISKYQSEKENMISKYDAYIADLKNEKENALLKLAFANNRAGVGGSSYAIGAANNLAKEYDEKIEALENEKNYNASIYDKLVATTKQSIIDGEKIKEKINKSIEVDNIYNQMMEYYKNNDIDMAISQAQKALSISQQYGLTDLTSSFTKALNTFKAQKEKDKVLKDKKIFEDATLYYQRGKEEKDKGNLDKSIEYINQAIYLLKNNNIDGGDELEKILENYLISIKQIKSEKMQREIEQQEQAKKEKQLEYENKLKEKANIAFMKIKNIISKKSISKQSEIYKGLLAQLETFKTKVSTDRLIVLDELNRLILNELNSGGDEVGNILNDVLK